MARISPIDVAAAEGKAKELLEGVKKALGATPNLFTTFAHSPAVLEAYLSFSKALSGGVLPAKLREQVALAVAGRNGCSYCASAHTYIGKGAGLDEAEMTANLACRSSDAKTQAALDFVKAVNDQRGHVSDAALSAARAAGYTDAEIAELIANVALNVFTNYFNSVAQTDVDFPKISVPAAA